MLSNLTEGVMYMLLVYWLGPLRPVLEGEPSVAWFATRFEDLLGKMQTMRRNPQAAIEAARQAAARLDLLHDNRLRALWYGLLALELAAEDPEEKARFEDARNRILDRGLKMVNASYVDEAAEADLVMTRVDDDVLRLLDSSGFGGGTMRDLFEAYRAVARELGERDRERTRIETDVAENARGAYARLRAEWLQTVKVFRATVTLIDPHTATLLTEKLDEMEARADLRVTQRRAAGGGAAAAADPVDDPDAAELAAEVEGAEVEGAEVEAAEVEAAEVEAEAVEAEAVGTQAGAPDSSADEVG